MSELNRICVFQLGKIAGNPEIAVELATSPKSYEIAKETVGHLAEHERLDLLPTLVSLIPKDRLPFPKRKDS